MAETAHCVYCFDVLAAHFEKRKPISLQQCFDIEDVLEAEADGASAITTDGSGIVGKRQASAPPRPLFVTWNKHYPGEEGHRLRGCIGTFENQDLETGLETYALTAALEDTRFNPIQAKDLPTLSCGVSILTDFEPAKDSMDWSLGTHGLRIAFVYHGRRLGATYLPDVPVEQGWTKEETLVSLMRKAGWSGRSAEWRKVEMQVTRYKGTKKEVSYADYKKVLGRYLKAKGGPGMEGAVRKN